MTKRVRGFQKVSGGIKWTRSGFVKLPDRFRPVSIKPQPLRAAKATAIKPKSKRAKEQPDARLGVKRPEKAKEQGAAVSAPPTPAPDPAKLATREICRPQTPDG